MEAFFLWVVNQATSVSLIVTLCLSTMKLTGVATIVDYHWAIAVGPFFGFLALELFVRTILNNWE